MPLSSQTPVNVPQTAVPDPIARMMFRRMLPSSSKFQGKYVLTNSWPQTPFRVVTHSGDLLLRKNAPSPISQLSTRTLQWAKRDSAQLGDGASGNQKYVHDHSTYIRYKSLVAKLKKSVSQ
jgi:hypothetical protein